MSQLLIQNGVCVTSASSFKADLLVEDGKIVQIAQKIEASAERVIDAQGRYVLPGGIDVHVHLPWPKGEHISQDDIRSGSRAAAFGGATTVIDFAIPDEEETLHDALEKKLQEARQNAWVDYSFHLNIRGDVRSRLAEIPPLTAAGFPSFKVFMAYEGFRVDDSDLLRIMETAAAAGGMVDVHAENGPLADALTAKLVEQGKTAPRDYAAARPEICEVEAIHRALAYQQVTGVRLHIHHVSTAAGAGLIAGARQEGRPVSGETCPHYLTLTNQDYEGDPLLAAAMVCAPSVKSLSDQQGLWQRLAQGELSVLATDHCPYSRRQKTQSLDHFPGIPGGIGGVELRLPLIFSAGVKTGRLSLERFVDAWATQPARLFGLYPRKGQIAIGSDADLAILEPDAVWTIRAEDLHMNTDCLPYEGWQVYGRLRAVTLRGEVLVENGNLLPEKPGGMLIPRRLN
ncbi:MAG: dihydropyrimidinase [Anaerolineae bacterium]|nr:dihydropyrimidinase [Anaerolineae bacterium]